VKLYSEQVSNFGAKCRIVIGEKGLHEIEIVSPPLEYLSSSEYLRINPLGKVPALEIDDSTSLFESEVINEYLEERFPQTPLMPPDLLARARARLICRFHDLYLEPPLRELGRMENRVVDGNLSELTARLNQLENLIGEPWLAGAEFTLADCSLAPTMLYITFLLPLLWSVVDLYPPPQVGALVGPRQGALRGQAGPR
jgi:glutathione S-transferase